MHLKMFLLLKWRKKIKILSISSLKQVFPHRNVKRSEDVTNGAISLNGERITDTAYEVSAADRLEDAFTIVRRGKKNYKMVKFV